MIALRGLHHHIDAMLQAHPDIPAGHVWERLIDEHDATASYSTLRNYVARQRRSGSIDPSARRSTASA